MFFFLKQLHIDYKKEEEDEEANTFTLVKLQIRASNALKLSHQNVPNDYFYSIKTLEPK